MPPSNGSPAVGCRSGVAAVAGRPNVGKSTLVNALVGEKVSITSPRPQTTRFAVRGVLNIYDRGGRAGRDDQDNRAGTGRGRLRAQVTLADTPGLHKPRTALGERLNGVAYRAVAEADCALAVFDVCAGIGPGDRMTAERLRETISPGRVVAALNKVDKVGPGRIAEQLSRAALWDFGAYVPVSARTGDGLDRVADELVSRMPEGPVFFPEGQLSDQPPQVMAAELIREKLLERLRDELPHATAVTADLVDADPEAGGLLRAEAVIYVERNSQKGIVIGAGGSALKAVGVRVRRELEARLGRKIFLEMRVKVERDWQSRPEVIRRLGL